ncbi:MAG: antibiotic biosynthesis monooxygenase [Actinomycetota bacterium]|nr:antibiotic biosynthesis monooxygenase [Actinomycetota bacterium]
MTVAVHITNTPKDDAREAYEASWRRIDELGLSHPSARLSHTCWIVDDNVLHVLDVWESIEAMTEFMQDLGPVLQEYDMQLAGPPEIGELVQVLLPA